MIHHVQLSAPAGSEGKARAFWATLLGYEEIAKAHPGLLVAGLDALADRLAEAGYGVAWDGDLPGMRRFYTADPFGNRIEFLEVDLPPRRSP